LGYLVGTDEAGYGPNLGPLVVSATVWEVPDGIGCHDLKRLLAGVVVSSPAEIPKNGPPALAIGDSKVLYQSGKGLRHLECGLWAAMALLGRRPTTWCEVWATLAPGALKSEQHYPWHAGYDRPLPLDADACDFDGAAAALGQRLGRDKIRLIGVRSRAIFPTLFNRLVDQHGSKGSALSQVTLGLAAEMLAPLEKGPISVICDKHGGRDHYERLLFDQFPDSLIEIRAEGRARSQYQFGPPERRVDFRFETKAECYVPAALASMASKYLRELAMRAWNDFWCARVDGLRPTAGYPPDGRRFKEAIAAAQEELGIDDCMIWRTK
jgi:hypothetical protein